MILYRTQLHWALGSAAVASGCGIHYVYYARHTPGVPTGGTLEGLVYGGAAGAIMVLGSLLAARRLVPSWRLGSAAFWLSAHVWSTLLSVPLVLYHTGFRMGDGPMTSLIMWTYAGVVASGILGVALQQVFPQRMTLMCPMEGIFAQIERVLASLADEARLRVEAIAGPVDQVRISLVAAVGPGRLEKAPGGAGAEALPLIEFYLQQVRPYLNGRPSSLERDGANDTAFVRLRTVVPPGLHPTVDALELLCEERRQLLVQHRLQGWINGWLFVHVPLSALLLVLVTAHTIQALRY